MIAANDSDPNMVGMSDTQLSQTIAVAAGLLAHRGATTRCLSTLRNVYASLSVGTDMPSEILEVSPRRVMVAEIRRAICDFYGLSLDELLSDRRSRPYARPRQIGMWLSCKLTGNSLPAIGRRFGNRDHTTVLYARRTIDALMTTDADVAHDVRLLMDILLGERAA
jgi:chromosomal replication initiator protein